MTVSFEQFFWAISSQETGGRGDAYSVVNAYGAVGKYQVLKSNIPSWTREALGHSMTWQQYRDSPASQEAVARYKLKKYYDAWGPRGAAAAWYAGPGNHNLDMSTRSQSGGPSIRGYVDSVINKAAGYTGAGAGGGGSTYSGTASVTPKLDRDELASQYGLSAALINSSKELKSLFNQAVSGGWSAAKFGAQLKNSKWWRSQSSTLRKYLTTKFTDPATWKQQQGSAMFAVNALAVSVGLGDQISKGKASSLLKQAMYNKTALGWTDARLKDWMGVRAVTHDGQMWGEAGEAFDKLHQLAYLNGMKYSKDWYASRSRDVVGGRSTLETQEAKIRAAAAARYSAFHDQILAGQDVMDLAAPYIKSLSSLLELPETDTDLFNKHIAKAMTAKPAAGAQGGTQMPLWEFENEIRADPLWRKTNNARESMMTVARSVARDFGLAW